MGKSHENKRYFYDRETKTKCYVSDEVYKEMCHYTDAYRQRMQYNGQCACRREDWWYCDTVCVGCRYRRISETGKNSFAASAGKTGKTFEIVSLDEEIETNEGTICREELVSDPIADIEDAFDRKLGEEALAHELERCDEIGRQIIELLIDGYFQTEIAEKLGLTQGQYKQRLKKTREQIAPRLRDYFY